MAIRLNSLFVLAAFGLAACGGGSDGTLSEEDSAGAAGLMAADLVNIDPSGDGGGGFLIGDNYYVGSPRTAQFANVDCESGSFDSGTAASQDVGSPFASAMDVSWEYYDNCQDANTQALTAGYAAEAQESDADGNLVEYQKMIGAQNHGFSAGDFSDPFRVEGTFFGNMEIAMVAYHQEGDGEAESEAFLDWLIEIPDFETGDIIGEMHFVMGDSPTDRMVFSESEAGGTLTREINGSLAFDLSGVPDPCGLSVNYQTDVPLTVESGAGGEAIASGQMTVTVDGGGSHTVEWINGQLHVNGAPFDERDLPETCSFTQEVEF